MSRNQRRRILSTSPANSFAPTVLALIVALCSCDALADRLPLRVTYFEPSVAGARVHGVGCDETGPPEEADLLIGGSPVEVYALRPAGDADRVSVVARLTVPAGGFASLDPARTVVTNDDTGRRVEVDSVAFRRRNRDFTSSTIELSRPSRIYARPGAAGGERVSVVVSVTGAGWRRLKVTFPEIDLSGNAIRLPEVIFTKKSGFSDLKLFC